MAYIETSMASGGNPISLCCAVTEPHQPVLNFPKRTFGKQKRAFSVSWYKLHPWLHYIQEKDCVLCFYCATAVYRKIPLSGYVDKAFTDTGFDNWKKALDRFVKHQQSQSHIFAAGVLMREKRNPRGIDDMLSSSRAQEKVSNQKVLLCIFSCIRFLAHKACLYVEST